MARPADPDRRDEVLDEVIGYVARHGLTGLTLRRLAAELGFSTQVISYQFGSKRGLVEAALMRARTEQRAVYERLLAADPDTSVAQGFIAIWSWWLEDPRHLAYSRMSIEAFLDEEEPDPEVRAGLLPYWIDYFTAWLERDGHPHEASVELATLLLSVQTGLLSDVISGGDRDRATRAMHRFARMLEPASAGARTRPDNPSPPAADRHAEGGRPGSAGSALSAPR